MNRFDDALRESLRRVPPPEGLADCVLGKAREIDAARHRRPSSWWRWTLAAAAVLTVSVAPLVYVQHLRAVEGERAKDQVLSALRVAGTSLRSVQARVAEVEARRIETPSRRENN